MSIREFDLALRGAAKLFDLFGRYLTNHLAGNASDDATGRHNGASTTTAPTLTIEPRPMRARPRSRQIFDRTPMNGSAMLNRNSVSNVEPEQRLFVMQHCIVLNTGIIADPDRI